MEIVNNETILARKTNYLRWVFWLIICTLVFFSYRKIVSFTISHTDPLLLVGYPYLIVYGVSAIFLCSAFLVTKKFRPNRINILGKVGSLQWLIGLTALIFCYVAGYIVTFAMGYPRELVMQGLGLGMTSYQYVVMICSLVVLPPIVEELAYRHFIFSTIPFENSRWIAGVAILVTAGLFGAAHTGYMYMPTKVLIFSLGLVLGWARWVSGGLLFPVALHASAEVIALSVDAVWKNWPITL